MKKIDILNAFAIDCSYLDFLELKKDWLSREDKTREKEEIIPRLNNIEKVAELSVIIHKKEMKEKR